MDFELSEEQTAIQEMAAAFAAEELTPHAVDWDQRKFFPVDTLRKAGELGFGGIYVRDDIGGSGLSRLDAVIIFEALAKGCPSIAAYISIQNMCVWMIDQFGSNEQRERWAPKLVSTEFLASSYYQQSRGDRKTSLVLALQSAKQAAAKSPQFGFAWERVAELEFSFGHNGAAEEAQPA